MSSSCSSSSSSIMKNGDFSSIFKSSIDSVTNDLIIRASIFIAKDQKDLNKDSIITVEFHDTKNNKFKLSTTQGTIISLQKDNSPSEKPGTKKIRDQSCQTTVGTILSAVNNIIKKRDNKFNRNGYGLANLIEDALKDLNILAPEIANSNDLIEKICFGVKPSKDPIELAAHASLLIITKEKRIKLHIGANDEKKIQVMIENFEKSFDYKVEGKGNQKRWVDLVDHCLKYWQNDEYDIMKNNCFDFASNIMKVFTEEGEKNCKGVQGEEKRIKQLAGLTAASGASCMALGAQIGTIGGPVGTVVGGVIGGIFGLFAKKAINNL